VKSQVLKDITRYLTSTAKCLSTFRSTKSNGLGLFNLEYEPLQYFKELMTAFQLAQWRNIPAALNPQNIAVITRNVASKHLYHLQVLVAALLLFSCSAFVKRYPHPLDCRKYFLRIDNKVSLLTCPNNLTFNQYMQQCTTGKCTLPNITPLVQIGCNQNMEGYYCETAYSFTYCTKDGLTIINNSTCPNSKPCKGPKSTTPCVP